MNNYPLINSETHFDMVIVANGSYPENEVGQTIIRHARHLIACDGAALSLIDHGICSEHAMQPRFRTSKRAAGLLI